MQQDFQVVGVNVTKELRDLGTALEGKENLVFAGAGIHIDKVNGKTIITAGSPEDGTLYDPIHITRTEYSSMLDQGPEAFMQGRLYVVDVENSDLLTIWINTGANRIEIGAYDVLMNGANAFIGSQTENQRIAVQSDLSIFAKYTDVTADIQTAVDGINTALADYDTSVDVDNKLLNYYPKSYIDTTLQQNYYTKEEVDALLATKQDIE